MGRNPTLEITNEALLTTLCHEVTKVTPRKAWSNLFLEHTCKLCQRSHIKCVFQVAERKARPLTCMHENCHLGSMKKVKKAQCFWHRSPAHMASLRPWDLQYQAHYAKALSKHRCTGGTKGKPTWTQFLLSSVRMCPSFLSLSFYIGLKKGLRYRGFGRWG